MTADQLDEFRQGEVPSEQSLKKVCVSNLRPDGIAVSEASKQIAILEFCRPSDTCPDQLKAAYDRKNLKYAVLVRALQHYVTEGWQVKILPWVVGIRGLIDEKGVHVAAEYLGIPRKEWTAAVNCTVVASVESLAFMHRVRHASSGQGIVLDASTLPTETRLAGRDYSSRKRQHQVFIYIYIYILQVTQEKSKLDGSVWPLKLDDAYIKHDGPTHSFPLSFILFSTSL